MNRRALLKQAALSAAAAALPRTHAFALPPEPTAIRFNQIGFLPRAEKIATILAPASQDNQPQTFSLVAEPSGNTVFTAPLTSPTLDAASGDRVAQAIFSSFIHPGRYRLVFGAERSEPFPIAHDVFDTPLRLTTRAFYGQRCGCTVDLGGGYAHPACHLAGAFHPSSGRQGTLPNTGGWHDAGDYGRYIVNSGIATGTLLWAWELYPHVLHPLTLDIPESGRKLPDFLAEIRWNLQWMLSLQDTDGGVWHKQTSEAFCAFIMPQDDTLTSFVIGTGSSPYKSTGASANLAAVMAIAARCYLPFDPEFAQRCLAAAKRAWTWTVEHPNVPFHNPPRITTGEYQDEQLADEPLWASAELWRTTRLPEYREAFRKGRPEQVVVQAPNWGDVGPLALWTYALADPKHPDPLTESIRQRTAEAAQLLIDRHAANGYGNTLAPADYIWGSNSVAGNQSLLLFIADKFHPERAKVDAALGNLDYLLGRNCFGVSWVTQVGSNPFQHPHHRPSAADGILAPWPGMLAAGPNARPGDDIARTLIGRPPMRMWVDHEKAYSLNEIAINWNAPLVFALAAAKAHALKSA